MARHKKTIDRDEFAGNYTLAYRTELVAILNAYRERRIGKADLRAFAARLESKALHEKSKVDIHRIVNARKNGRPSMSQGAIEKSLTRVDAILADTEMEGKRAIISREMARYIAHGRATCSEVAVILYYSLRRKKQNRRLERLAPDERYARFHYRDLFELSGCRRATLCRAVARLRARGLLELLVVHKLNENSNGNLFVDGSAVSLTPQNRQACTSCVKPTTRLQHSDNAPHRKPTTPINKNPKRRILNKSRAGFRLQEKDGVLVASVVQTPRKVDPEILRIQARSRHIQDSWLDAVA